MNGYPLIEVLLVAVIVGWSARYAWRELAPLIRASLQRRESSKACGSGCGGCDSDSPRRTS